MGVVEDLTKMTRMGAAMGGISLGFATGVGAALINGDRREGVNVASALAGELALAAAGVTLEVQGEENLWSHRPAIFLFNHQSEFDVPILAALLRRDFTGVAKKSLERNPIFGPLGKFAGMAFIDRGDPAKARAALASVVESLAHGISIAVAPEGTRNTELGPFKKGPFHMAIQGGVPVVPVVIRNAAEIVPPKTFAVNPGVVQVVVLPPVDTSGWSAETVDDHRDEIRQMYVDTLAAWPEPEAD